MGLTVKNLICHVRVTLPHEQVGTTAGRPLDLAAKSRMEALLDDRFDDVVVHTDGDAAAVVRGLNADAVLVGRHVYFGGGRFDPLTRRGLGLLAHELVHRKHAEDGTSEAKAEHEAMRAEREVADADRPKEPVYLDAILDESPVNAEEAVQARATEPVRPPEPSPPTPGDIEDAITAKVIGLMRSEIVIERERRGLLGASSGRLPL
jgi:uncharacterized protein DUF4157